MQNNSIIMTNETIMTFDVIVVIITTNVKEKPLFNTQNP